ncbi:MAG: C25 family cysteine peptidase [candidate division WOR-3 bacterium]
MALILILSTCFIVNLIDASGEQIAECQSIQDPSLFIIGLNILKDWRDFAVFATIPLLRVQLYDRFLLLANSSSPYEVAELSPAQIMFIETIKPKVIYVIGANASSLDNYEVEVINGRDEVELAYKIATKFWQTSSSIVVVEQGNYTAAMLGSLVASKKAIPLIYFEQSKIENLINLIHKIKVKQLYYIGSNENFDEVTLLKLNVTINRLQGLREIYEVIGLRGINYVVIANPNDITHGEVRKLSLISPLLATFRNGILIPLHLNVSLSGFLIKNVTNSQPHNLPQCELLEVPLRGPGKPYPPPKPHLTNKPPRGLFKKVLYPVKGNYMTGWVWLYGGGSLGEEGSFYTFYLGADSVNATAYDAVIFDFNKDGNFTDDEFFKVGETVKVPMMSSCVSGRAGSDDPGYRFLKIDRITESGPSTNLPEIIFQPSSWLLGEIEFYGKKLNAVGMESYDPIFRECSFRTGIKLFIDLDGDGEYVTPQEGPFITGQNIIQNVTVDLLPLIGNKPFLLSPSSTYIKDILKKDLKELGIIPRFLALVGYVDSIPPAVPVGLEQYRFYHDLDLLGDEYYQDLDQDGFGDIAVGRIVAQNIYDASLLLARTISYQSFEKEKIIFYAINVNTTYYGCTPEDAQEHYKLRQEISDKLLSMKYCVLTINSTEEWFKKSSYVSNSTLVFIVGHGSPYWWARITDFPHFRFPAIFYVSGCSASSLYWPLVNKDYKVNEILAFKAINKGAVAIVGNTRWITSIEAIPLDRNFIDNFFYNFTLGELVAILGTQGAGNIPPLQVIGDPMLNPIRMKSLTVYPLTIVSDIPEFLNISRGIGVKGSFIRSYESNVIFILENLTYILEITQPIIVLNQSVRWVFTSWEGDINSTSKSILISAHGSMDIRVKGKIQYYLRVFSQYGETKGKGWHDAGSQATVSVSITRVEKNLFTSYVFEGWMIDGELVSTSPTYSFTVTRPVSLTAVWRTETNLTTVGAIAGVILLIIVVIIAIAFLKKRKQSS